METNKQYYTPAEVRAIVEQEFRLGGRCTVTPSTIFAPSSPLPGLEQRIPDYDPGVTLRCEWGTYRVFRDGRMIWDGSDRRFGVSRYTIELLKLPEEYRQAILARYDK